MSYRPAALTARFGLLLAALSLLGACATPSSPQPPPQALTMELAPTGKLRAAIN